MSLTYECSDCGMGVKGMCCAQCGAELQDATITTKDNKKVQVAQCPNDCGKINSPMCCGHDMHAKHMAAAK